MITTKEYIELNKKSPWYSKDYSSEEEREVDKEKIREYNKALIAKYPWVEPTNRWSGKRIIACSNGEPGYWPGEPAEHPDYDYSYTELDEMPDGWRVAFGDQMCDEIQAALLHAQELDPDGGYEESYITTNYDSKKVLPYVEGFRITQIKEKYGKLRFYCNSAPKEIYDIINKYESLSWHVCIKCGKPSKWTTSYWISPYCNECKERMESNGEVYDSFELIEECNDD